jgi:hypothetical protein
MGPAYLGGAQIPIRVGPSSSRPAKDTDARAKSPGAMAVITSHNGQDCLTLFIDIPFICPLIVSWFIGHGV